MAACFAGKIMSNYCIFRFEKHKSLTKISDSSAHTFREQPTDNADPDKLQNNIVLRGKCSTVGLIQDFATALGTQKKIRLNAVLAVEYYVGVSPESQILKDNIKLRQYFDDSLKHIESQYDPGSVLSAVIHVDETTDHLVVQVVPMVKGKLHATAVIGGHRDRAVQLQDQFFDQVGKKFGLDRGIKGSKADHLDVKKWYAQMRMDTSVMPPKPAAMREKTSGESAKELLGIETTWTKEKLAWDKKMKDWRWKVKTIEDAKDTKARYFDAEKPAIEARKKALDAKEIALDAKENDLSTRDVEIKKREAEAVLRKIDLGAVLKKAGAVQSHLDASNWLTPSGSITLDDGGRYRLADGKLKKGAIDLAIDLFGCKYNDALQWLRDKFGGASTVDEAKARAETKAMTALEGKLDHELHLVERQIQNNEPVMPVYQEKPETHRREAERDRGMSM